MLNAAIAPQPLLAIDVMFGPITEAAIRASRKFVASLPPK